ncbi:hypothetical protein Pst134EA_029202 [Puccinia striiformis f. sp. tritici]|uniref:hypothetical protein n=1 Tax=Puccinia striiformis f. sp. tritici TaxID=168172 RepID=UPI002008E7EC|nr:hypothetical protein Pst134EA_029202 [Puccinia striiformis f. sp. tritici]KAH9447158.1 hypothetical protein Pst134EA_029202 [Puccinia striiformis f. sp. tritici]
MASSVFEFAKKNLGLAPDPKLNFRSSTLAQLHASGREIPSSDTGYWSNYYTIFDFSSEVTTLISINELRKVIRLQPQNMITLTKILVSKLDSLVHSDLTKKALIDREITPEERATRSDQTTLNKNYATNNNSFTNQLKGFSQKVPSTLLNSAAEIVGVGGSSNNKLPKGPLREILNCVRVLTRILPLLMEEAASNDPTSPTSTSFSTHEGNSNNKSNNEKAVWINNLLWGTQQQDSKAEEDLQRSQFVLDEDDQDDQDSSETVKLVQEINQKTLSSTNLNSDCTTNEDKPALMVTLIDTILDLLFLPGVCVPAAIMTNSQSGSSTSRYPIWTGGIGSSQTPIDHSPSHNSAKVEVIRLLLSIISKPLYSPPHLYSTNGDNPSISDILGYENIQHNDRLRKTLEGPNPALTYLCTQTSKPILLSLLCSLLNTSLAPIKSNYSSPSNTLNTIANGIGRMTSSRKSLGGSSSFDPLEPNHTNANASPNNTRRPSLTTQLSSSGNSSSIYYGGASSAGISQDLPGWSAALLSVLLLPDPIKNRRQSLQQQDDENLLPTKNRKEVVEEPNGFRIYLSKIHRTNDLNFIIDNLLLIIMKPMTVTYQLLNTETIVGSSGIIGNSFMNNGIGGGGGAGGQLIEGLMILQLSLESNPRLISHLISTGKIVSIMISLIFICLEQKDSISPKSGLVKLCAITLQLLTSQDRKELAHLINSKVDLPVGIRAQYSVPGTLADFLIVSICSVIFSTISSASSPSPGVSDGVNNHSTFTSLILCLTNLSPFFKDLNSLSSNSLSKLFLILSTPSFLLKEESNVKLLYYVLECFNNIIHYQMPDNPHLIYSIIKVHQRIESLGKFTLKEGIKEIERAQQKRRSLNQIKGGNETPRLSRRGSTRTITSLNDQEEEAEDGEGAGDKIFDVDDHEFVTKSINLQDKGKGKMRDNQHQHPTTTMIDPQQYNNLGSTSTSISGSSSSDQFQVQGGGEGSRKSSMNIDRSSTLSHSSENWSHHHSKKNSASSGIDLDNLSSSASSFSTSVPGKISPASIGRNGFVPTKSWVASWRDSLPLDTIQIMVTELKPKVIGEGSNKVETQPSAQSLNLLRSATLLGMIPQPDKRSKKARRFEFNNANNSQGLNWIGSYIWSMIFIKDSNSMSGNYFSSSSSSNNSISNGGGGGDALRIKLFGVKILPRRSSSGIVLGLFKPFVSSSSSSSSSSSTTNNSSTHNSSTNNSGNRSGNRSMGLPASRSASYLNLGQEPTPTRDRHLSN